MPSDPCGSLPVVVPVVGVVTQLMLVMLDGSVLPDACLRGRQVATTYRPPGVGEQSERAGVADLRVCMQIAPVGDVPDWVGIRTD